MYVGRRDEICCWIGVGIGVEGWIGGGMDDVIKSELKHVKD